MSFTSRDLRLVVGAKAVSFLGDEVATIALVLRLQSHGAGAGAVAGLLIANLAPMLLLAGVVGRLVDRRDNRRLLLVSSVAQAVVCGVLAFVVSAPLVLVLVTLLGVGQAVNGATWQALLPSLVTPERLPRALSLAQAANTVAGIVAPALAGVLTGVYGARVPLLIDTATFVAVTVAALLLRTTRAVAVDPGEPMRGGFSIVAHHPLLRATIALIGLFILLGSMVNVVEVFLVRSVLHASATWYGILAAAYAVGLLVGSLAAGRLVAVSVQARAFVVAAALLGAGLAAMGLAPDVAWLLVFCLAAGSMNGVLSVCTSALVMGTAEPAERGRVGALLGGVLSGTQLAAYAVGGVLSGVLGPRQVFVGAGVLGMVAPIAFGRTLLHAARRANATPPATLSGVAA